MIVRKNIREDFTHMPPKSLEQVKAEVERDYVGKVFLTKGINFMTRISGMVKVTGAEIREDWDNHTGWKNTHTPIVWVTVDLLFKTGENWHPAMSWKIMPFKEFISSYNLATEEDKKRLSEIINDLTVAKKAMDNEDSEK